MSRRRVVLVDDHLLFRSGVRTELGDAVEIVGEAGSIAEAVPLIRELDPDVVLLDVHLPDGGGHAVIAQIAPERPGVRSVLDLGPQLEQALDVLEVGQRLAQLAVEYAQEVERLVQLQDEGVDQDDIADAERAGDHV